MKSSIGILGFGVVGKSALKFLTKFILTKFKKKLKITIWDKRCLSSGELDMLEEYGVQNHAPLFLDSFFKSKDQIFVSPGFSRESLRGINKNKILCELDFFSEFYKKPVVAITGSLGKTTITSFLNYLSRKISLKTVAGGNIGNALLDLIPEQSSIDIAFLELSSFQLKFNKKFAPNVAVFNNFYSNHLDWHENINDYFESKCKIFEYQNSDQFAIFPVSFLNGSLPTPLSKLFLEKLKKIKSQICFVGHDYDKDLQSIIDNNIKDAFLFSKEENSFIFYKILNGKIVHKEKILDLNILPDISFEENWLYIVFVFFILNLGLRNLGLINIDLDTLWNLLPGFSTEKFREHRLELFLTKNNVDFYNDSKSTVFQATIKALDKLEKNKRPIILILGGLSKGVDRTPLLKYLNGVKNLKKVLCFGPDCNDFSSFESYSSLDEIVDVILKKIEPGDQVLFSPSGSSFDLFKNYKHRGECFKELVLNKVL